MKKYVYIISGLVLVSLGLENCAMQATSLGTVSVNEYENLVERPNTKGKVDYVLPEAKLVTPSKANLTKNGITITCEIEPINVSLHDESSETPVAVKPDANGKYSFDKFEIRTSKSASIYPERIIFNLDIRNNSGQILRLHEIGLALLIDGENYVLDTKNDIKGWENGMILNGFSKSYAIYGPTIKSIGDSKLFAIILQGVPTMYDDAGVVSKRETFEWTYSLSLIPKSEEIDVRYEYSSRPVRSEMCVPCKGLGYYTERNKCSLCNGYGVYRGSDGKTYKCPTMSFTGKVYCGGTGYVDTKVICTRCSGNGELTYPLSPRARVTKQINYYGYKLKVVTIPSGGTVEVYDYNKQRYVEVDPTMVKWWIQSDVSKKPIKVTQNGKTISLFPYNTKGNVSSTVKVDFSKSEVVIKNGQIVE